MYTKRVWYFFVVLFCFLQIADVLSTYAFIDVGGVEVEFNPIIVYLINKYGLFSVLVFKIIGTGILVAYLSTKSTLKFKCNVF